MGGTKATTPPHTSTPASTPTLQPQRTQHHTTTPPPHHYTTATPRHHHTTISGNKYMKGSLTNCALIEGVDALIWQLAASVALPGYTIHQLVAVTVTILDSLGLTDGPWTAVPTAVGLATIPFIVKVKESWWGVVRSAVGSGGEWWAGPISPLTSHSTSLSAPPPIPTSTSPSLALHPITSIPSTLPHLTASLPHCLSLLTSLLR